jgi:hypothetical protein
MAVKMTRSDFIQRSLLTAGGLGTLGFSSFQSSKAGEIPEESTDQKICPPGSHKS